MTRPIPLALQLYSVREEAAHDLSGTLRKVASIGYRAVELAGYYGRKPAELRRILDDVGLQVVSVHGPLPTKENSHEIMETVRALGNRFYVSGFGTDQFATRASTQQCAQKFREAAELVNEAGMRFGFHNHWWEFETKFDGKTAEELVLDEAPNVCAQLDTYWCAVGGGEPSAFIRRYGQRIPLLHIKDGPIEKGKPMTAVGEGKMTWDGILSAAQAAGVQWLIVELDKCATDMLTAVERSFRYLVDSGYGCAG